MDSSNLLDGSGFVGGGLPSSLGGDSLPPAGPQSPIDMKPDAAALLASIHSTTPNNNSSPTSPSSYSLNSFGSPLGVTRSSPPPTASQQQQSSSLVSYPPNHPLSGSKHFCSICGDRASGKHYGVYSCEGCKGFFKRTVRKELSYACRENRDCIIDKRQRNRCQYCRYMKCLQTGMRREAVQEERHRTSSSSSGAGGGSGSGSGAGGGGKNEYEVESTSGNTGEMPIERIVEAETIAEMKEDDNNSLPSSGCDGAAGDSAATASDLHRTAGLVKKRIMIQLIEWGKHIPHFTELKVEDQVTLLRSGWNELLIAGFSFRSTKLNDGILLGSDTIVTRENAHTMGVGAIFDRVLVELISKMKEMHMDKAELGCLRAIILFNPDAKGLSDVAKVEGLREKVYATLEEYTRSAHENEPSRFAKLLLRLPALRSIGLKCMEHLFFYKLIGDSSQSEGNPLEQFIQAIIEDC